MKKNNLTLVLGIIVLLIILAIYILKDEKPYGVYKTDGLGQTYDFLEDSQGRYNGLLTPDEHLSTLKSIKDPQESYEFIMANGPDTWRTSETFTWSIKDGLIIVDVAGGKSGDKNFRWEKGSLIDQENNRRYIKQ